MKTIKGKTSHETNIDNDWNDFLMGCDVGCGREEESPYYDNKNQNKSNYANTNSAAINDVNTSVNCYTVNKKNKYSGLKLNTRKKKICNNNATNSPYFNIDQEDDHDNGLSYVDLTQDQMQMLTLSHNNNSYNSPYENQNDCIDNHDDDGDERCHDNHNMNINEIRENTEVADTIEVPKCSPIYISTKTKILFLDTPIDIKKVFWEIPIMPYASQCSGIIKKQIKFSCTTKEELEEIEAHTQKEINKNDGFIETQVIEHIDNPDGRIKFKDHRKINIGLSKKDILNCRSKKKRAFFNCFVLIVRIEDENSPPHARIFKEMHIKVFNTGKLEIPGIQHDDSLQHVIDILIQTLKTVVGENIQYKKDKCETVLINSNFNCGFYIDRDRLYNILKYKYRINSNYDSCSYPGIQCKFFYYTGNDSTVSNVGQQPTTNLNDYIEISFMIFRTGSVLIVGKCEDYVLHDVYAFLKEMFRLEFLHIYSHVIKLEDCVVKKHVPKLRSRTIINNL